MGSCRFHCDSRRRRDRRPQSASARARPRDRAEGACLSKTGRLPRSFLSPSAHLSVSGASEQFPAGEMFPPVRSRNLGGELLLGFVMSKKKRSWSTRGSAQARWHLRARSPARAPDALTALARDQGDDLLPALQSPPSAAAKYWVAHAPEATAVAATKAKDDRARRVFIRTGASLERIVGIVRKQDSLLRRAPRPPELARPLSGDPDPVTRRKVTSHARGAISRLTGM
jgi:hypothetical protein